MLKKYLTHNHPVIHYIYKLLNVLLYLSKMIWNLYLSTPMGKQFFFSFEERAQIITDIIDKDAVYFSIELTITAFIICLLISVISQILYIARYLYHSRGLFGKIILWALPMTAVVAIYIQSVYEFGNWITAYAASLVPTLCLFSGCFKFSSELLPEIGSLGSLIKKKLPNLTTKIKIICEKINES